MTILTSRLPLLSIVVAAVGFAAALPIAQAPFDVVIRGGSVIDGSGAPARRADVGIRGDSITQVGDLSSAIATRTIDAAGLVVAPGFIDMHTHSDYTLLVDGRALSKVTQGVTTELIGESDSPGPVAGPMRQELENSLVDFQLKLDWSSLGSYFGRVERQKISVNLLSTVGSGTVRAGVVGFDDRPATPRELQRMASLVEEAMHDGAVGVSSGLIYTPNSYASTEELIALCRVAARSGGIYFTHLRNEGEGLLGALDEAIRIGRETGIQVEVLHLKRSSVRVNASGETATLRDAASMIEKAQGDGVRIYADVFPYASGGGTLTTRIPSWAQAGGTTRMLERLRDAQVRAKIRGEIEQAMSLGVLGNMPDRIFLARTPYELHRKFLGKHVAAIASAMAVSPAEAVIELIDKGDGRVGATFLNLRETDVEFALTRPWVSISSDGQALPTEGVLARRNSHPRSFGTFPRVLGHYVRERNVLTLEEAIRKMTSLPASRLKVTDRGSLEAGKKADIVIFDHRTIAETATFEQPQRLSTGIHWVLVNGQLVIDGGRHSGNMPGRVLRHRLATAAGGR